MKNMLMKIRVLFQLQRGLLFQYGWLKAWKANLSIDGDGEPIPWITYPAIDFIKQFDYSSSKIFEWGSGYSTLWWAKRCKLIVSVEAELEWFDFLKSKFGANVNYRFIEKNSEAAMNSILMDEEKYDVIVIDNFGEFRKECCKTANAKLNKGGYIILDNSDQCLEACKILRDFGYQQIDFTGFVPGSNYAQTTSIFFKEHLDFHTIENYQPARSVAQPNLPWPNC